MQLDGDRVNIPLDAKSDDLNLIKEFLLPRLDYIEEIGFEEEGSLPDSSATIALLVSLKKSKPSLKIPFFDKNSFDFGKFGVAHWICYE